MCDVCKSPGTVWGKLWYVEWMAVITKVILTPNDHKLPSHNFFPAYIREYATPNNNQIHISTDASKQVKPNSIFPIWAHFNVFGVIFSTWMQVQVHLSQGPATSLSGVCVCVCVFPNHPNLIPLTVKIEPSLSLPSYSKHNLFKLPIYRASSGAPIPEKERQSRDIVASRFNGYHPYFSETLWTAFDENT